MTSEKTVHTSANLRQQTVISDIANTYDEEGKLKTTIDNIEKTRSEYVPIVDDDYDYDYGKESYIRTDYVDGKQTSITKQEEDFSGNLLREEVTTGNASNQDKIVESEVNTYSNDGMGRLKTTRDQDGTLTEYSYDELGREIKTVITNGSKQETEQKTYYPNGQVKTETAVDGTTTSYKYDSMNRVISKTVSKGTESFTWNTSYEYGDVMIRTGKGGNLATETISNVYIQKEINPNGKVTSITYTNGKGQVVRKQENGSNTDYTYDQNGNVVVEVVSGVQAGKEEYTTLTVSVYDENARVTHSIKNPVYKNGTFSYDKNSSSMTKMTYDEKGNVLTSTDANGNITRYEYDETSRINKVTLPDRSGKNQMNYSYIDADADGNATTVTTNAKNAVSTVKVDAGGRTLETVDKNSSGNDIITKEYYDSKGNHIKTLYSNNAYKKYEYDLANKIVTTTSYNSKGTQTGITKSYEDRKGNVIKSIDYTVNDKTITPLRYSGYEYDFLGRKIAEYEIDGTEAPTNEQKVATKISYTYDVDGNVKTVTYGKNSDIKRLTYNYNDFGWLTNIKAIVVKGQGEKEVIVREYKYNSNGTVREMKECTDILNEAVNYITKTYTYDSFCRVSSMVYMNANGKQVETYSYSYDKNSNIVRKNVQYGYSKVDVYENKQYVYNELGQLVETISSNKEGKSTSTFYKYDVVGNRIEMIDNKINCTTKYEYNDLNQLLSSTTINNVTKKETSKIKYAYDQNGNQISKEDAITKESVSYEYDVENRLVNVSGKKTDGTSYTQENRYNGSGQRIYKRDMEIGATTKVDVTRYYYQDGMVAYTTNESGNLKTFNYYGVDNNIIGSTRYNSGNVEYYLYNKDIQGSTTNIRKRSIAGTPKP